MGLQESENTRIRSEYQNKTLVIQDHLKVIDANFSV